MKDFSIRAALYATNPSDGVDGDSRVSSWDTVDTLENLDKDKKGKLKGRGVVSNRSSVAKLREMYELNDQECKQEKIPVSERKAVSSGNTKNAKSKSMDAHGGKRQNKSTTDDFSNNVPGEGSKRTTKKSVSEMIARFDGSHEGTELKARKTPPPVKPKPVVRQKRSDGKEKIDFNGIVFGKNEKTTSEVEPRVPPPLPVLPGSQPKPSAKPKSLDNKKAVVPKALPEKVSEIALEEDDKAVAVKESKSEKLSAQDDTVIESPVAKLANKIVDRNNVPVSKDKQYSMLLEERISYLEGIVGYKKEKPNMKKMASLSTGNDGRNEYGIDESLAYQFDTILDAVNKIKSSLRYNLVDVTSVGLDDNPVSPDKYDDKNINYKKMLRSLEDAEKIISSKSRHKIFIPKFNERNEIVNSNGDEFIVGGLRRIGSEMIVIDGVDAETRLDQFDDFQGRVIDIAIEGKLPKFSKDVVAVLSKRLNKMAALIAREKVLDLCGKKVKEYADGRDLSEAADCLISDMNLYNEKAWNLHDLESSYKKSVAVVGGSEQSIRVKGAKKDAAEWAFKKLKDKKYMDKKEKEHQKIYKKYPKDHPRNKTTFRDGLVGNIIDFAKKYPDDYYAKFHDKFKAELTAEEISKMQAEISKAEGQGVGKSNGGGRSTDLLFAEKGIKEGEEKLKPLRLKLDSSRKVYEQELALARGGFKKTVRSIKQSSEYKKLLKALGYKG